MDNENEKHSSANTMKSRPSLSTDRLVGLLFSESIDPILIADVETGLYVECNPAAEKFFGYTRDKLIGMHQAQLHLPEELIEGFSRAFIKHRNDPSPLTVVELRTASGENRTTSVRTSIIEVDGTKLIIWIFRDITDKKEAEAKIARRVAFERTTAKLTTDLLRLEPRKVDDGITEALKEVGTFTNTALVSLFLMKDDTPMIGNTHEWCAPGVESLKKCMQGVDLSTAAPLLWETIGKGELFQMQDASALPVGSMERKTFEGLGIRSLLVGPMFIRGRMAGIMGLSSESPSRNWTEEDRDVLLLYCENMALVLERRWSEEALRQSREALRENQAKLSLAMDMAKIAPWELDHTTGIFTFNDQFYSLYGTTAENEGGYTMPADVFVREFFHPDDANVFDDEIEIISDMENQDFVRAREHRIVRRDGEVRHIMARYKFFRNSRGELIKNIGANQDITESKVAEEKLRAAKLEAEAANKTKTAFLANMSHEIRTPMNAIIGMAYLVKKTNLDARQQNYLDKIDVAARSLLNIINDILDLSKVEAGMLSIEHTIFRLEHTLEHVTTLISPKANEKQLEFLIRMANDVPKYLVGDPLRLSQVLSNLCDNAVKFTEKGDIILGIEVKEHSVGSALLKFQVQDEGIGMTEEQIDTIFNAFTQADASTTRRYGGTGLGLSLCRQIVERMNGKIGVESSYGKGSTFWFEVEMGAVDKQEIPDVDANLFKGMRALVVDDNPTSLSILKDMLINLGLETSISKSGSEALEMLRNTSTDTGFDLLVLDWRMPDMNGFELAQAVRLDKTIEPKPPVLMVSAYGDRQLMDKANSLGFLGLLYKPVNPSLLFDLLAESFHGKQGSVSKTAVGSDEFVPSLPGAQILLVEDNAINRQVAKEIILETNAEVHEVADGRQALEFLEHNAVDLVLMDIQMPEMDGFSATERIRQQEKLKNLPIIAMTAHAMAEDRERCFAIGMNGYISKPFNPDELFKILGEWITPEGPTSEALKQSQIHPEIDGDIGLIDGVDTVLGLKRARGKKELYRKMLLDVCDQYAGAASTIAELLAKGNKEEAVLLAHSVKGVSGMLGAMELSEASNELEQALVKDDPNIDVALCQFRACLSRVVRGVESLRGTA